MTEAIKRRKGTTAEHTTFVGLEAELTIDTTKDTAVVHDGVTPGGIPLSREDLGNSPNFSLNRRGIVPGYVTGQENAVLYASGWSTQKMIGSSLGAPSNTQGIDGGYWIDYQSWNLYGPKANGVWPSPVSLIGPTGDTGATGDRGNAVLHDTRSPIASDGFDGDFWINTSTWFIYGPKNAGTWPAGASIIGPKGDKGDTGDTGLKGDPGRSIILGVVAPLSTDGFDGDTYLDTAAWKIYGPKSNGLWGVGYDLHGAKGDTGTSGNTVLNGTIDPTNGVGVNGDFYLNTTSKTMFGPKASGVWPTGFSIVGPQGPTGVTGTSVPSGGTSGQILVKNSATNYDYSWLTMTATTAEVWSASSKFVNAAALFSSASPVLLTQSSNGPFSIDLSTGFNFILTMAGNITVFYNPSNPRVGQSGLIIFKQDATGNRQILSFESNWKFFGGVTPILTTVPNTYDAMTYYVASSSLIFCTFLQAAY